jgi:cyclomaltodextrinase / maltogenic alpha-amylase / neopullulanase
MTQCTALARSAAPRDMCVAKRKVCSFFSCSGTTRTRAWCLCCALSGCVLSSSRSAPALRLQASDADVWSYRVHVDGALFGVAELTNCRIQVGTQVFSAPIHATQFSADIQLSAGMNAISARCVTRDAQPLISQTVHYLVRLRDGPVARAHSRLTFGQLDLDGRLTTASEREPAGPLDYTWFSEQRDTRLNVGHGARLSIAAPTRAGRHGYAVRVTDARGREDWARTEVIIEPEPAQDAWPASAILYGVLPRAFGTAGLADVTAALDSLAELGINALWLAPLFDAPPQDFGYAVTDYFHVRAEYGGDAALAALVREAHRRQLRVLLDLPANHTARQHPYFVDQTRHGTQSHYYAFYARDALGRPTHYFDWDNLFNLNYDNTEVARFMSEVADHWLRDFVVDGYRVDAAWGVRERSPAYWPRFNAELRRIRPELLLIAEASARDAYYVSSGFDAAYDWTDALGHPAWQDVFTAEPGIARRLNAALERTASSAPGASEHALRFLNNNDTGERFITRHGAALTRVASAALLTLPGIPCLYTFDEQGAAFKPYALSATLQERDPALREFHKRWIGLRRAHPALFGPGFTPVEVGDDELYAYLRSNGPHSVLVLLNFSGRTIDRSVRLPVQAARASHWRDLLNGAVLRSRGVQLRVRLEPWDARALAPSE